MMQRVRFCKTNKIEDAVAESGFEEELEVDSVPRSVRQQGLALLVSLQQTPQLRGHTLHMEAPLGSSTIWRPLQEVRVIPTGVINVKAVRGQQNGVDGTLSSAASLHTIKTAPSRASPGPLMYRRTSNGRTKLDVLKQVPLELS